MATGVLRPPPDPQMTQARKNCLLVVTETTPDVDYIYATHKPLSVMALIHLTRFCFAFVIDMPKLVPLTDEQNQRASHCR